MKTTILLIFLSILLYGCQKSEPLTPAQAKVQYVIKTEHGYVWYNIRDVEYSHPIHTIFDTTFYAVPGWDAKIQALTTTKSMRVSLIVNDKIIASEQTYNSQNITIIRGI